MGRCEQCPGANTTRREFVSGVARTAAGGALAAIGLPLLEACAGDSAPPASWKATSVVDVSGFTADGEARVAPVPGSDGAPILIVREPGKNFVALSMQCTHEGCPVKPPVNGVITCPCHGSQYDLEGKVLRGPAAYPLPRYETLYERHANRLVIRLDG